MLSETKRVSNFIPKYSSVMLGNAKCTSISHIKTLEI